MNIVYGLSTVFVVLLIAGTIFFAMKEVEKHDKNPRR